MYTLTYQALLATAVADAIGSRFEFGSPDPKEVERALWLARGGKYRDRITDDTQMTMFGMEALLEASRDTKMSEYDKLLTKSYVNWYHTQKSRVLYKDATSTSSLLDFEEMYQQRAPGLTCMGSLEEILTHGKRTKPNHSNGCGAVMRLLPFGLMAQASINDLSVANIAVISGLVTHDGEEIIPTCSAYIDLVRNFATTIASPRFKNIVGMKDIRSVGEGWTAKECLDMAVWAVANAKTYEQAVLYAISHPGDSDSVAAVAGGLWVLRGGYFDYSNYGTAVYEVAPLQWIAKKFSLWLREY